MNVPTTITLRIAIAAAVTALAGCTDKPVATTSADATTDAASAPAPASASAAADAREGLTAREMISAPRGSVAAAGEARGAPAPHTEAPAASANAEQRAAAGRDESAASQDDASAATGAHYADVISVQPSKRKTMREREECRDERIVHKRRPKDDHQVAGTVIGALAGGVIGHQVGGGRGRDLATVAGAVGGGYAGKKIQQDRQDRDTYVTTERRCRTVKEPVEDVAYDVVYEYLGQTHQVRLDHDPGDRIELPVRGVE